MRVIPNVVVPELMVRFNIGTTEIGQFCGLYYVGYVLAHIPVGILLDRFGSKIIIPACIMLTSLGVLPLVSSNNWSYSIVGREELKTKLQESESKNKELESKAQELEILKDENNNLKIKLQESESKNKELGSKAQRLEILRSASESKIQDLQKQLESKNKELEDNKDRKPPAVNVQGVKSKVNYASASFILSGVCAVGTSLATPYLAICIALAVAASVFLALGGYCLYKANTILSHVEVDQQDNQQLLESSL